MSRFRTAAAIAALALAFEIPMLAQRGGNHGGHGGPGRGGGNPGPTQSRDTATVVDRMLTSPATRSDTGVTPLPGLGSASLIAPRPGVDRFRAAPGTYDSRGFGPSLPAGPSWGGRPLSVGPSWGGVPVNQPSTRPGDRGGPRHGSKGYRRGGYGYPTVVYSLPYEYFLYAGAQAPEVAQPLVDTAAQADYPEGFLRLLVTPRDADVLVDGVHEGTVDDFGGAREQALASGPHHVRIEAPGYAPVDFDVRVPVGDTISLRRDLSLLPVPPRGPAAPEPGAQAPAARKTFYAIPRCYLGDAMPLAESLPPGCSLKDVRVLPQQ